jgi:acyl-CoA reductase-like NAD-dependent aldehyde dehydrogenase
MKTELFIDNEWKAAASGKTFGVENPATEEIIAQVAEGGSDDIDLAVKAARRCFESDEWQGLSARKRGKMLLRLADALRANKEEIAQLETSHNGKPLFESHIDIGVAIETLRYFAGWADKLTGETLPTDGNNFIYTVREAVGVVGAIVPWNFPLNLAVWKIAPAIAAGCTVVLKPAEDTPLTALAFAALVEKAGFPAGALNVVPGFGESAGAALVNHPDVDKISFTGSTEVGRLVAQQAAASNKRVTLELGGKSPNIIFADANLKAAIRGAQTGIFYGKGEVCAAGSRVLAHSSVYQQVVEGLAAGAKKRPPGDPLEKTTRLGALVSRKQQERVMGFVGKGVEEGAELVAGGNKVKVNGKGHFVEATVFASVKNDMTIAREEIFGPVVSVMSFDTVEEAVALANDTEFGLAAGVWTQNLSTATRVSRAIRAGTVWVNTYGLFDPAAPFGGYKSSGYGRDLGRAALEGYLETKTVWMAV